MKETRGTQKKRLTRQQRQRAVLVGVIGIVVLLALGAFLKKGEMKTMIKDSATPEKVVVLKSEEDYVNSMIPHHQEAVDSSRYISTRTENAELRNFANTLVDGQTREIWTMIGQYQQWYGKQYSGEGHYMKMMPDLTKLSGAELDKAYIRGMIDHHMAAIDMSNAVVLQSDKENFKNFAKKISEQQTKEVEQLKGWLAKYPQ